MEDEFLPSELRGFDKQKAIFQDIYDKYYGDFIEGLSPTMIEKLQYLDWIDLNIVCVDFVLWHFAQKGYVLTKKEKM